MLTFKKLELTNFRSFKSEELELNNQGLQLVEGQNLTNNSFENNGSGKSTLFYGITYALYDTTGNKEKADEIINREEGKNTAVKLYFEKDGVDYRIERYRKHHKHKNKVLLFENDKDITSSTNAKTNEQIEAIIGIAYETYSNSILYGGNTTVFSQATDKGKKEILENITNIAVYKQAQEVAKEKLEGTKQNQQEYDLKIRELGSKAESIKQAVEEAQTNYQHVQNQIDKVQANLQHAKEQLEENTTQDTISSLQEELNQLERETTEPFIPDNSRVEQAQTVLKQLTDRKQEIEFLRRQSQTKLTELNQEQASLDTQEVCPTCGAPMNAEHAKRRWQELEVQKRDQENIINQYRTILQEKVNPVIEQAEAKVREEQNEIEQDRAYHQQKETERNNRIYQIKNEITSLQNKESMLESNISRLEEQMQSLHTIPKPATREEELKELNESINQLKEENNLHFIKQTKYEDVVKAFSNSGVRSVVLDLVTPTLNESANRYLDQLSDSYTKVRLTTQVEKKDGSLSDKFEVEVTQGGEEASYQTLSQGERTRVDVAISLALQDLVYSNNHLRANIALYDEVFDGLDEKGVTSVIDILKEKAKEIGSVFVISHSDTFKPLFENVLTIVKENGESKIQKTMES